MPIYPLPPQESAATLFCNYSFFKGQGHHLVCREKEQSQHKSRLAELSEVQGHKYISTQTLQQPRKATIPFLPSPLLPCSFSLLFIPTCFFVTHVSPTPINTTVTPSLYIAFPSVTLKAFCRRQQTSCFLRPRSPRRSEPRPGTECDLSRPAPRIGHAVPLTATC